MPRILFIHNSPTRFVNIDLEILKASCEVTELYLRNREINPLTIAAAVQSHDIVFGWFAFLAYVSTHSLRQNYAKAIDFGNRRI